MQIQGLGGKLTQGRNSAVLLGIVAAVIAAILLLVYVTAYRSSVNEDTGTVTVFVAKRLIKQGTAGSEIAAKNLYVPTAVPTGQVREGAITDPSVMSGRALQADVFPGSQIADADFQPAAVGGGLISSTITGQFRAVSITIGALNGSLPALQNGDRVDIYQQVASGGDLIKLFRANVPVLQTDGTGTVILQVPTSDAADVLFASKHTELFFVLRPSNGAKPTVPRRANTQTMLQYDRTH
jgi:Flp pilus assembly protein CpaB